MKKVVWFTMVSLDGFESDRAQRIDFHVPSRQVHDYINQLNEANQVMLLDRDGYEIMKYWDDPSPEDLEEMAVRVYSEQWKHLEKVVVARDVITLPAHYSSWQDVTPGGIDRLIAKTVGDILVGSASLAWRLLKLERLDEIQIMTVPILLGTGMRSFSDCGDIALELIDHRAFANGWIYAHYRVRRADEGQENAVER